MAQRIGGIQDVELIHCDVGPESVCATVGYKIPYQTLGFSTADDFWAILLGQMGGMDPILKILKEILQKNAPFLEGHMSKEFGSTQAMWKWLIAPQGDTRFYSLKACTPDLLQFATEVEVKA